MMNAWKWKPTHEYMCTCNNCEWEALLHSRNVLSECSLRREWLDEGDKHPEQYRCCVEASSHRTSGIRAPLALAATTSTTSISVFAVVILLDSTRGVIPAGSGTSSDLLAPRNQCAHICSE